MVGPALSEPSSLPCRRARPPLHTAVCRIADWSRFAALGPALCLPATRHETQQSETSYEHNVGVSFRDGRQQECVS